MYRISTSCSDVLQSIAQARVQACGIIVTRYDAFIRENFLGLVILILVSPFQEPSMIPMIPRHLYQSQDYLPP